MDLLKEKLAGTAVFTVKDVARITGKPLPYCRLFLSRLASRNSIIRVERGKYCLKNADPMEVASNLAFPSYISFLSALSFHHLTTQIPVEIQIACTRQKKQVSFAGMRIVFITLKNKAMFGFGRQGNVFIAEPEKALIDCLYRPDTGHISEVFQALKQKEMDAKKLEEYAERLGSAVVKKRLGFLLEKAGIGTTLSPRLNTKMDLFNPLLPKQGKRNGRWRMIINEAIE